jgi:hypothetical protein
VPLQPYSHFRKVGNLRVFGPHPQRPQLKTFAATPSEFRHLHGSSRRPPFAARTRRGDYISHPPNTGGKPPTGGQAHPAHQVTAPDPYDECDDRPPHSLNPLRRRRQSTPTSTPSETPPVLRPTSRRPGERSPAAQHQRTREPPSACAAAPQHHRRTHPRTNHPRGSAARKRKRNARSTPLKAPPTGPPF